MSLEILYGVENNYRDITRKALLIHSRTKNLSNILTIAPDDNKRAQTFGDHIYGTLKHIIVKHNGTEEKYEYNREVVVDISDILPTLTLSVNDKSWFDETVTDPLKRVQMIHDNILFIHGDMKEEFPEQIMAATFIQKDNCVLELGANTGRNTLVIASILSDSSNLVTLETDSNTCAALKENRDINNYNFHIENAALSKRSLIQRGWDTMVSDIVLPGYFKVNNITFDEIEQKYNKKFDTLVADCEGALYYIFQDFPEMLTNINTIIMENDYKDLSQKHTVDQILSKNGFRRVYVQEGGWQPCYHFFFETWKKL